MAANDGESLVLNSKGDLNGRHKACQENAEAAVEQAFEIGKVLFEIKARCTSKEFEHHIGQYLDFSFATAKRYLTIYQKLVPLTSSKRKKLLEESSIVGLSKALPPAKPPKPKDKKTETRTTSEPAETVQEQSTDDEPEVNGAQAKMERDHPEGESRDARCPNCLDSGRSVDWWEGDACTWCHHPIDQPSEDGRPSALSVIQKRIDAKLTADKKCRAAIEELKPSQAEIIQLAEREKADQKAIIRLVEDDPNIKTIGAAVSVFEGIVGIPEHLSKMMADNWFGTTEKLLKRIVTEAKSKLQRSPYFKLDLAPLVESLTEYASAIGDCQPAVVCPDCGGDKKAMKECGWCRNSGYMPAWTYNDWKAKQ